MRPMAYRVISLGNGRCLAGQGPILFSAQSAPAELRRAKGRDIKCRANRPLGLLVTANGLDASSIRRTFAGDKKKYIPGTVCRTKHACIVNPERARIARARAGLPKNTVDIGVVRIPCDIS